MTMYKIKIPKQILSLSKSICRNIQKEWYAFPLGQVKRIGSGYEFIVETLYVPEQYASYAHVEIPSDVSVMMFDKLNNIISKNKNRRLLGMWHSHGGISVFHSSEDLNNINVIFRCFLKYIPSFYVSEEIVSIVGGEDLVIEPIIADNSFKGLKIVLGSACVQIDFSKPIQSSSFFVRWYKHFYDIKCMMEVLKGYYDSHPTVKSLARNKSYYIMSVVVNNLGDLLGEIFVFEHTSAGINKKREKAKVEIINLPEASKFENKEVIKKILERIK
ncbi:MAG: hypothetical protein Q6363_006120 [Candidatus Njordarchaeota archaeon]